MADPDTPTPVAGLVPQAQPDAQPLALWLFGRSPHPQRTYRREAARFLAPDHPHSVIRVVRSADGCQPCPHGGGRPATAPMLGTGVALARGTTRRTSSVAGAAASLRGRVSQAVVRMAQR